MIIAIVSEMSRSKFQWSDAWNVDNQLKYNCYVQPIEFSKQLYYGLPKDHSYWNIIRKADLVYVYCTRISDPDEKWAWWRLPEFVKGFMKPEAKMIAQIDDDWVGLFNPNWVWWQDFPYGTEKPNPVEFFKKTGILDIPDMWFSVLEKPEFSLYTTKPVKYVPLPQLNRYPQEYNESVGEFKIKGLECLHGEGAIGIMRHSSRVGSVQHSLTNVLDKIGHNVVYFSTERGTPTPVKSESPIKVYPYLGRNDYMGKLRNECKITLDDTENYTGWSRFAMESAINYIPCISSNQCGKILFPDLYVDHKDYKKQTMLIRKLLKNNEFYTKVVIEAHDKLEALNDDSFCKTTLDMAKELNAPNSEFDVKKELFMFILRRLMPHNVIPVRPCVKEDIVYDPMHERMIYQEQWDKFYGHFTEYIDDKKLYKSMLRQAAEEKNKQRADTVFFEVN